MFKVNSKRAMAAGLTFRPVEDTYQATYEWDTRRPANHDWKAGLSIDRENDILRLWHLKQHDL
jgi:2'-hydroxyisoflavone reductase